MDDNSQQPATSGWSFLKVLGVVVGLISMAGFGVCTLCGMFFVADGADVIGLVLAGAVMTALSIWLVVFIFRKVREAREGKDNSGIP